MTVVICPVCGRLHMSTPRRSGSVTRLCTRRGEPERSGVKGGALGLLELPEVAFEGIRQARQSHVLQPVRPAQHGRTAYEGLSLGTPIVSVTADPTRNKHPGYGPFIRRDAVEGEPSSHARS